MASLRELQTGFADAVLAKDSTGFFREVISDGLSAERRLDVYRHNVFGRLTNALRLTYPMFHRLVGEGYFRRAAAAYIHERPSTSGDLTWFGDAFPAFLTKYPSAGELPYLPEIARLEWLCHESYHAAEHAPLMLERLANLPLKRYESLRFTLHPACRLFTSRYPVHRIWEICQPEYTGNDMVDLASGGVHLLIERVGLRVVPQPLGKGEFALLQAFASGQRFATACAAALETEPGIDLSDSLRRFVVNAIVVDFSE
jgi:hypothetical protein